MAFVKGQPNPGFKKGQSGNPSGRPKDLQGIKALCQEHAPLAIAKAVEILKSKNAKHSDKLKAADMILDRAYGKPLQEVKGVQFNAYTQIWTNAAARSESIGEDGRVRFKAKAKGAA
jgi:hypothetical protein